MGWDTKIIILAETFESKNAALRMGKEIYNLDSRNYGKERFYIIETKPNFAIYYTYERRKYAPYLVIQEISKNYEDVLFTILGTMLDFVGGPSGIIKILNSKIIDSYGIGQVNSKRYQILQSPTQHRKAIFDWFKTNGIESELRADFTKSFPKGWCDGNFADNIIPIDENKIENQSRRTKDKSEYLNWEQQPKFE